MIKVVAVADLHLGKMSTQVPNKSKASSNHVLKEITTYCIEEKVDVVLMVGDIVDRENKFFEAYPPLRSALEQLSKNNITTYFVGGNHDYDTLPKMLETFQIPDVHFLGKNATWESMLYEKDNQRLQIVGWSFPNQYHNSSPFHNFNTLEIDKTIPTIGIVHGDYDSSNSPYAPLLQEEFNASGITTWILGHIHKHGFMNDGNPVVVYPGSPQALSPKELGEHGILSFYVQGNTISRPELLPFSDVLYTNVYVNIPIGIKNDEIRSHLSDRMNSEIDKIRHKTKASQIVVDLILTGYIPDLENLRTIVNRELKQKNFGAYYIRKVDISSLKATDYDLDNLATRKDMIGSIAGLIRELEKNQTVSQQTEKLLKDAEILTKNAINNNTYEGLRERNQRKVIADKNKLRDMILKEANIILAYFLEQIKERNHG